MYDRDVRRQDRANGILTPQYGPQPKYHKPKYLYNRTANHVDTVFMVSIVRVRNNLRFWGH